MVLSASVAWSDPSAARARALWIGAGPEGLAAADVSAPEAARMLKALEPAEGDRPTALRRHLAQLGHERSAVVEALRASPADAPLAQRLGQLDQDLAAAEAELAQAREDLAATVLAPLSDEQRQRLATVRAVAGFRVPTAWKAEGAAADWHEVELASVADRRAQRHGGVVAGSARAPRPLRGSPAVAQAQVFFAARIQELRALFATP
jgi:hypothetical protein